MKLKLVFTIAAVSGLLFASCADSYEGAPKKPEGSQQTTQAVPVAVTKSNTMQVYAHYMSWFETTTSNPKNEGKWDYHWTMKSCDPNKTDANDKRQIASHHYPQTGPYANGDEAVLDYQCLLMKYTGLDGVMVDWYGVNSNNSIALHKSNTEALLRALKRAGLRMSVVYEDRTFEGVADKVGTVRQDLRYLAESFFKDNSCMKVKGRPLLLDFGPIQMESPKDWYRSFSILTTKPMFLVLEGKMGSVNNTIYSDNVQGVYIWVNPNPNYAIAKGYKCFVGGAMPGFWDYYKEGEGGTGYQTYNAEGEALLQRQLDAARQAGLKYLQINTWNNYGEGTIIEPTLEYGYKYLLMLQKFTGVSYQQTNLELIYRWCQARVAQPNNARIKEAYNALVQLKTGEAKALLGAANGKN